jgi:hypothetical protein
LSSQLARWPLTVKPAPIKDFLMTQNEPEWERYAPNIERILVAGGYIYKTLEQNDIATTFVPDVDLQRYQAHLRDAYNQGFQDGRSYIINEIKSQSGFREAPIEAFSTNK